MPEWADMLDCDQFLWLNLQLTDEKKTLINHEEDLSSPLRWSLTTRYTWEFSASERRSSDEAQSNQSTSPRRTPPGWGVRVKTKVHCFALKQSLDNRHSKTTEAETGAQELLVCVFVQEPGSTSWWGRQGFGKNPAMTVTCAIKHVHWRMALTELWQPLAERPKWLGSPRMPADLLCQRQCADKACLVHSHHCIHARTRKAKDAVQQSHYLALVLFVGATEEELHRASSSTFVQYDFRGACKYFDLILKQPFV